MGFHIPDEIMEAMKDNEKDNEIKKEMKNTRKKNTKWESVMNYPCPCQVEAIRYLAPRGKQTIMRTIRKAKGFLWFKKQIHIKLLTTYMPAKEDGEYFWKQTEEIEI